MKYFLVNRGKNELKVPKFGYQGSVTLQPEGRFEIEQEMIPFFTPYRVAGVVVQTVSEEVVEPAIEEIAVEVVEPVAEEIIVEVVEPTIEEVAEEPVVEEVEEKEVPEKDEVSPKTNTRKTGRKK